jgi:hypothetical protein
VIYVSPVLSPLVALSQYVFDREIYAIQRAVDPVVFDRKINRYKVLYAIQTASTWMVGTIFAVLSAAIFMGVLALGGAFLRTLELHNGVWMREAYHFLPLRAREYTSETTEKMADLFMTPEMFEIKRNVFVQRLFSPGIGIFDTYQAVLLRTSLLLVAFVVWKSTRSEDLENHRSFKMRRDGRWSQIKRFLRLTFLVVNVFPLVQCMFPDRGGENSEIVDLVALLILVHCAVRSACESFDLLISRDTKKIRAILVWISISIITVYVVNHHTCRHDNLFPTVGHSNVQDGLLSHVFDMGDFKTMSAGLQTRSTVRHDPISSVQKVPKRLPPFVADLFVMISRRVYGWFSRIATDGFY